MKPIERRKSTSKCVFLGMPINIASVLFGSIMLKDLVFCCCDMDRFPWPPSIGGRIMRPAVYCMCHLRRFSRILAEFTKLVQKISAVPR